MIADADAVLVQGYWCETTDPWFPPVLRATRGHPDIETIAQAVSRMSARRRFVDVGACIGTWTRQLAGVFDEVVAFEPDPGNHDLLRTNVRGLGNVLAWPIVLGDGSAPLVRMSRRGTVNQGQAHVADDDGPVAPCLTLDHFGFDDVDLIKVDVEGFEKAVIDGARSTILASRPVVVIEENEASARYQVRVGEAREALEQLGMVEAWRIEYFPQNHDVVMAWPGKES